MECGCGGSQPPVDARRPPDPNTPGGAVRVGQAARPVAQRGARSVVVGTELVGYQDGKPVYKQVNYPGPKH